LLIGTFSIAIAIALIQQGASVILTGRNIDKLYRVVDVVRNKGDVDISSSRIECIACDVTQEESVVSLFQTIEKSNKRVDILINNAGINVAGATIDLSADDFNRVMHVNVTGPFLCAREAMKRMIQENRQGRIINIGSLSASSPRPDSCPYTTSKFALQGLTRSLALDGRKHGITAGIIHPGNVRSELLPQEVIHERHQSEGFIDPQDVANCVVTMLTIPLSATVLEMTVLPSRQPFVGRG
jgi:NAD(P)-dependent dehydrogenase (short-subunit alcohol dehydrogenase family)